MNTAVVIPWRPVWAHACVPNRLKCCTAPAGYRWWNTWCRRASSVAPRDRIVVVTGHQADTVEALLEPMGVRFARQVRQKGTGDAVECAREQLQQADLKQDGLLLVLYGDTPLLSATALKQLREAQSASDAAATLITTTLNDPTGYGYRDSGRGGECRRGSWNCKDVDAEQPEIACP